MKKVYAIIGLFFLCYCSVLSDDNDIIQKLKSNNESLINQGLFEYMLMPVSFRLNNIDYLIVLINNKNINIRLTSIGVIGDSFMEYDRTISIQTRPLFNPQRIDYTNPDTQNAAKKVVPVLIKQLSDKNPLIVKRTIETLSEIGPLAYEAVKPLIIILHNKDYHLRSKAIIALGNIGPKAKEAIPLLQKIKMTGGQSESELARKSIELISNN